MYSVGNLGHQKRIGFYSTKPYDRRRKRQFTNECMDKRRKEERIFRKAEVIHAILRRDQGNDGTYLKVGNIFLGGAC